MVNETAKQVQEMPVQEDQVNYLDLNDEIVAKYNIKKEGTETVTEIEEGPVDATHFVIPKY